MQFTKVNDHISVSESVMDGKKSIFLLVDSKFTLLSEDEHKDGYTHTFNYDKNYIVSYSYGSMAIPAPLMIKAVYNIREHKMVDISNPKMRTLFEYMLAAKRPFSIDYILTEINGKDLGLLGRERDKQDFHDYLTSGNNEIPHQDIVDYIVGEYPCFEPYTDLDAPLAVSTYRDIEDSLEYDMFYFYAMPQLIEPKGTGLKLLYTAKSDK